MYLNVGMRQFRAVSFKHVVIEMRKGNHAARELKVIHGLSEAWVACVASVSVGCFVRLRHFPCFNFRTAKKQRKRERERERERERFEREAC